MDNIKEWTGQSLSSLLFITDDTSRWVKKCPNDVWASRELVSLTIVFNRHSSCSRRVDWCMTLFGGDSLTYDAPYIYCCCIMVIIILNPKFFGVTHLSKGSSFGKFLYRIWNGPNDASVRPKLLSTSPMMIGSVVMEAAQRSRRLLSNLVRTLRLFRDCFLSLNSTTAACHL